MVSHGSTTEQSEREVDPLRDGGVGSRPSRQDTAEPAAAGKAPAGDGRHRVVIVGGGFGGLAVAQGLSGADDVDVTLVDKRNFHLFQPLLYQVATGALSPGDVAAPLREALRRSRNTTVLLGDVADIDVEGRCVLTRPSSTSRAAMAHDAEDQRVPYDTLVLATGLVSNYFGHDEWERLAPGLKSIEDATEVRSRLLLAFEEAERTDDPARRRALLTFVVVGAGATGVEMAGAIVEIAQDTLPVEFRRIAHEKARVVLLDAGPRVLPAFRDKLSAAAERDLRRMGVEVRTSTMVREVDANGVVIQPPGAERVRIDARLVVWAAGVRGASLAARLAEKAGVTPTRQGTLPVEPDLSLAGHPEIRVIGDAASFAHDDGKPLPGVAQVAIQQGRYVARSILESRKGIASGRFRYDDRGSMATIGRAKAVADLGWTQLTGLVAWVAWLFVHLLFLVGYENRILVLTQWAWYYVWRRRSARLITAWPNESP